MATGDPDDAMPRLVPVTARFPTEDLPVPFQIPWEYSHPPATVEREKLNIRSDGRTDKERYKKKHVTIETPDKSSSNSSSKGTIATVFRLS